MATPQIEKHRYMSNFSGCDITAVLGNEIVGELLSISYSVNREKGPVYTLGSANPRSFARGKRAIAGSMVFTTIDQSAFVNHFSDAEKKFYSKNTEVKYSYNIGGGTGSADPFAEVNAIFGLGTNAWDSPEPLSSDLAGSLRRSEAAWYPDQILPFDINIAAANEYGQVMKMNINDCEILNGGSGISIDDLVIEEQYTFIARDLTGWEKVDTGLKNSI